MLPRGLMRAGLALPLAALLVGLAAPAPPARSASLPRRPVPAISRALVISVDGLRPDLLLRAQAPVIRGLMDRGSFTMWARTTAVSVTLPSHVSMLTGVRPGTHGIEWNTDLPLKHPVYPNRPTLFELAKKAGYTTAMVAGKAKFTALAEPKTLDWFFVPVVPVISDRAVTDSTLRLIDLHQPQVLFVHFPEVDSVGHEKGWGSAAQLDAIARADRCVGEILDALERKGLLRSTVVLVTSDHGGAGTWHGADDVRSREIPWIIAGPGIRRGLDLTTDRELEVRTEDTFATICFLLGIHIPKAVDGRLVKQVLGPY